MQNMWRCYLFISHELNSRFWSNLYYIHGITPPQWFNSTLLQHLLKTRLDGQVVLLGTMNLKQKYFVNGFWQNKYAGKSKLEQIYNNLMFCYFLFERKMQTLVLTCKRTFNLSNGAVHVRDTAPAPPPATRCRHHMPVCSSFSVKSSGTRLFSPMSMI